MKKVEDIKIGQRVFVIEEDAYIRLKTYLEHFREKLTIAQQPEVMADLEDRIAELFQSSLKDKSEVINISLVENIVSQLGMPDGSHEEDTDRSTSARQPAVNKKFYRDTDQKTIAGVCSGLAAYFNLDVMLVRVIMLALLVCGSAGLWIYLILWIVAPKALSAAEKCELRGLPVTAENIAKFSARK